MQNNIENMIERAKQLNMWLLEKAQIKKLRSEMSCPSQKETATVGGR